MAFLVESSSLGVLGCAYPLDKEVIAVGRSPAGDIVVADHTVSKLHARLLVREGAVLLRDAGSRNGTYVNGERVAERELREGDELRIGGTKFRLMHEAPTGETRRHTRPDASGAAGRSPIESVSAAEALFWEASIDHLSAIDDERRRGREPIEFMTCLLNHLMDMLGADRGAVVLVEEGGAPAMRIDGERDAEGGADGEVALHDAALRHAVELRSTVAIEGGGAADAPACHAVALPIVAEGELLGVAQVERALQRGPFYGREIQLAKLAVSLAGSGIRVMLADPGPA